MKAQLITIMILTSLMASSAIAQNHSLSASYTSHHSAASSVMAQAHPSIADTVEATKECRPHLERPRALCNAITQKIAINEGNFKFAYQMDIIQGACVTEQDPPEEVAKKVQVLWKEYEEELVCDVMSFDVANGNLLKLAVSHRFDPFINDVLKWGVNLNRIDRDNKTVLDYIQGLKEQYQGSSFEARFNRYYQRFQAAGAKHRSELPE